MPAGAHDCCVICVVSQGYRVRRSYIATQAPLVDTTEDFWRMLWEHGSNIVVMLCSLKDHVTGRVSSKDQPAASLVQKNNPPFNVKLTIC